MSKKNTTKNKSNHAKRVAKKAPVEGVKVVDPKKVAKEKKEARKILFKRIFTVFVCALLVLLFALPSLSGLMSCSSKEQTDEQHIEKVEKLQDKIQANPEDMAGYVALADEYFEWGLAIHDGYIRNPQTEYKMIFGSASVYYEEYGDLDNNDENALKYATSEAYCERYAEANAVIDKLLAKNPENSGALNMQAYILAQQGDPDNAIEIFKKVIELDNDSDAVDFAETQLEYIQ